MKNNIIETHEINAYNAYEFLQEAEKAFKLGFTISDATPHYPQVYLGSFSVVLVKYEEEVIPETKQEEILKEPSPAEIAKKELIEKLGGIENIGAAEVIVAPKQQATRGRKAK